MYNKIKMEDGSAMTESYELIMYVNFHARGKDLDARTCNPLLRQFREMIEKYRLEEGGVKAWPQTVDEFKHELIDSTWLTCSLDIKWNVYDPHGTDRNEIRSRLLRDMLKLKLEDGKYSAKITIQMKDAVYQYETKHGRWPQEKMHIIGF